MPDMYSDKFVLEMDRRYRLMGSNLKDRWALKELGRKAVIEKLLPQRSKRKWDYLPPLKNGKVVQ